jgi:hypothetical protein
MLLPNDKNYILHVEDFQEVQAATFAETSEVRANHSVVNIGCSALTN